MRAIRRWVRLAGSWLFTRRATLEVNPKDDPIAKHDIKPGQTVSLSYEFTDKNGRAAVCRTTVVRRKPSLWQRLGLPRIVWFNKRNRVYRFFCVEKSTWPWKGDTDETKPES